MAKFKVGDKVRIIKSLDDIFHMRNKIGQINTIEKVWDRQVDHYFLREDLEKYIWRNEELELVEPPHSKYPFYVIPHYVKVPLKIGEEKMTYREFLEKQERLTTHLQKEKNKMNNIHFINTIAFNKKTFKTTMVLKYQSGEYAWVEVISNKKDFVDFRVGFLLAFLKFELYDVEYKALIHELFRSGKPRITFLQGYASHLFDNFRQMNKVLDAIKSEKDQVNIGGRIIKLVWKE